MRAVASRALKNAPTDSLLFPSSLPPSFFSFLGIVGVKSPLFRIDKAMKAVQEALLDGELGEEVSEGRKEGSREGGREGGREGRRCRT